MRTGPTHKTLRVFTTMEAGVPAVPALRGSVYKSTMGSSSCSVPVKRTRPFIDSWNSCTHQNTSATIMAPFAFPSLAALSACWIITFKLLLLAEGTLFVASVNQVWFVNYLLACITSVPGPSLSLVLNTKSISHKLWFSVRFTFVSFFYRNIHAAASLYFCTSKS